jgi:hypothetical protein
MLLDICDKAERLQPQKLNFLFGATALRFSWLTL